MDWEGDSWMRWGERGSGKGCGMGWDEEDGARKASGSGRGRGEGRSPSASHKLLSCEPFVRLLCAMDGS